MFPAIAVILLAMLASAAPARAQTPAPTFEVFAGYSLLGADAINDFPRETSHGVQVGLAANLTSWFGVFADFGAQFNRAMPQDPVYAGLVARSAVREFYAGPRFTARLDRVDVFAHGLIGFVQGDAGDDFSGFSDSGLSFGGGGGLDVHVNRRFAVRTTLDWIGAFVDIAETNPRFAVGVVAKFGGS
jgi:hypothetical protein